MVLQICKSRPNSTSSQYGIGICCFIACLSFCLYTRSSILFTMIIVHHVSLHQNETTTGPLTRQTHHCNQAWMSNCIFIYFLLEWASYQIRKIADCACAGNAGNVFPATPGQRFPTCITAHAWRTWLDACRDRYLAVSFEIGVGENVFYRKKLLGLFLVFHQDLTQIHYFPI